MRLTSTFLGSSVNRPSLYAVLNDFKREKISKVKKAVSAYKKSRESKELTDHFCQFFHAAMATSNNDLDKCYRIRHEVYCEEMKYLPTTDTKLETTDVDAHSLHCTIQHKLSQHYAGTVRLVYIENEDHKLPIEQFCEDSITDTEFHPGAFERDQICEISRLAVPASFRRRKMDQFKNASTGGINEYEYSEKDLRCFPFVAIGLYLAAGAAALRINRPHVYVMMEPRLARNLKFVGISSRKIGETVEYHGVRAPYYINVHEFKRQLKAGFKTMLKKIGKQLYEA